MVIVGVLLPAAAGGRFKESNNCCTLMCHMHATRATSHSHCSHGAAIHFYISMNASDAHVHIPDTTAIAADVVTHWLQMSARQTPGGA